MDVMIPREAVLCRSIVVPTSLGLTTPTAGHLSGVRPGVAMLVISGIRSIKPSPTCAPVPWAVSGPPVTGGLPRTDSGRVSCVHYQRGEVEAHPPLSGRRNP